MPERIKLASRIFNTVLILGIAAWLFMRFGPVVAAVFLVAAGSPWGIRGFVWLLRRRRGDVPAACPADVMNGLLRLKADPELSPAAGYIDDMILYAQVGRARHTLTMEYVTDTEQHARTSVRARQRSL